MTYGVEFEMIRIKKSPLIIFLVVVSLIFLLLNWDSLFAEQTNRDVVMISELMANNSNGLSDEDGDYSDWIELYNRSPFPVNLTDWSLTDDPDQPDKWLFPDISIAGNDYLVVFASGKDRANHTNFKLDEEGEFLALYRPNSRRYIDSAPIRFGVQFQNISYGIAPDGDGYRYFSHPSPGSVNDGADSWLGLVEPALFSVERGLYRRPFTMTLTTATPDVAIYYTADGSEPNQETGVPYTKAIPIKDTSTLRAAAFKSGYRPSASVTHSYIFVNDVLSQPVASSGFPTTWGLHGENFDNKATGEQTPKGTPVYADYEMDPDVVNNPRFHAMLEQGLAEIPSLSIVMDQADFTQIYSKPRERGVAWERLASIEYFDPKNPELMFQRNAGIRIQGHGGRWEYIPKHSFRLFFRSEYDAPRLYFPLFPDSAVQDFNTLILRGGVNRSFAGYETAKYKLTTYLRDQWMRDSQIALSGSGPHGIFVHLYINGLYWGLYNLVERPDAAFAASYFGGDREDWHAHNHSGPISGSTERIMALGQMVLDYEHGGFADPANYAKVEPYLDIPHFVDYMILNFYAGNQDWPVDNWYAVAQNPSGKLRFFVWDAENSWKSGAGIELQETTSSNLIGRLFTALMYNPDFKITFADRVYKHLHHNGVLTGAKAQERWRQLSAVIDRAIVAESARWGDARYDEPITRDDWLDANENVLAQMDGNAEKLVDLLRERGFYPPIDPPTFSQQGGLIEADFALALTADEGMIYYTLNGTDPRETITGSAAPGARPYTAPISINAPTRVKARLRRGDIWSALNEAAFWLKSPVSELRLTEIMYNPPGGDDYEFIELSNFGSAPADLSNMYFAGIRYAFPAGATLAAGEMLVLVSNPDAFAQRYPAVKIGGVYQGKLSNKGETLSLKGVNGEIIFSITYNDENGWPLSADGRGDSLVVIDPLADLDTPQNWRASEQVGGSPGWVVE